MEIVNGSIFMEADGVRHTVAEFSFDGFESSKVFLEFAAQFLNDTLRSLVGHKVPVYCDIDSVAVAELDEYNATIVVGVPDPELVALLWPVMVLLSKGMSEVAGSEAFDLVDWGTYEEMGALV